MPLDGYRGKAKVTKYNSKTSWGASNRWTAAC